MVCLVKAFPYTGFVPEDGIEPEFINASKVFGSVIHTVIAEFYKAKMEGERMSLDEMLIIFERFWHEDAQGRDDIVYKKDKDFNSLLLEGKGLLSVYYKELPDDNFRVIAIEEPFLFKILN